ncbi:DUF3181 family protein [Spirulina sp. CCNP1310]|uniref:DUF3181 family protein n=1 Tax=Spirulina sp. CCNP1310 TaxID=3110249 RepID=UPI002B1FDDCF|nr:DUF3181 family protein [Spirulina sp. CCNP1310]MEA5420656.1 DUF3181 family protein [Spirulina sp. CCNP1310]
MPNSNPTAEIEALASVIGGAAYIDIAKWHLYLNDAKLHATVAQQLYPLLLKGPVKEEQVTDILAKIPVKIGGGQREIPLLDLLPVHCQVDLMDALEEYQAKL